MGHFGSKNSNTAASAGNDLLRKQNIKQNKIIHNNSIKTFWYNKNFLKDNDSLRLLFPEKNWTWFRVWSTLCVLSSKRPKRRIFKSVIILFQNHNIQWKSEKKSKVSVILSVKYEPNATHSRIGHCYKIYQNNVVFYKIDKNFWLFRYTLSIIMLFWSKTSYFAMLGYSQLFFFKI